MKKKEKKFCGACGRRLELTIEGYDEYTGLPIYKRRCPKMDTHVDVYLKQFIP